jgi:hypothetical protein
MFSETTPEPVTGFDAVFGFIMSTATFPVPSTGAAVWALLMKVFIRYAFARDNTNKHTVINNNILVLKPPIGNTRQLQLILDLFYNIFVPEII